MGKYFGTDGFRGKAGVELTAEHAFKIGRYLGGYLKKKNSDINSKKSRVVIGKDPRLSSYMLEYAIASGLASSGSDVYLLHVTTTPSVSYVTISEGFDLGIMITASHNPFTDNGIKIIDSNGEKLNDSLAELIEEYIDYLPSRDAKDNPAAFATGAEIGRIYDHYAGRNGYVGRLISLASSSYKGLKIGLDSANGAAFSIARSVFAALGAETYSISDNPNGLNVNYECGSTHTEALARFVKERHLDIGFAFDGDADRCIAIDEYGNVVDGDGIMYILAKRFKRRGTLKNSAIVATVMSNGGLVKSLYEEGISTEITKVGDRFVYEKMQDKGLVLGGEQSGHIIMSDLATTGDGILTAIMLTEEVLDTRKTLSELCLGISKFPQRNLSVRVKDKDRAANDRDIKEAVNAFISEGKGDRRILVRQSGTEPVIRIMAEAASKSECDSAIDKIMLLLKSKEYIDG